VSRLLVVDDEPSFPKMVAVILERAHSVDVAPSAEEALTRLDTAAYDIVLTDLHMPPGADGIELIRQARQRGHEVPFIVLTGQASVETAVGAMREGAFDYLRKTASADELRSAVARAVEHGRMRREVQRLRGEVAEARGVERPVGTSPALREVMRLVDRIAPSDASVLILGESGTGKELLARVIHRQSLRRDQSFVAFDCSALAPSLLESELFGHERGAFTGADRARRGLFREAQGGTLFLDEIGDIAPEVQNKLLRVLQEREVKPVGGDTFVKIDVRIVAATNKDLRALVKKGVFREDLFYRLAVVPVQLPPLRERVADIPSIGASILRRRRSAGPRPQEITPEALARLAHYAWPGNIRELENVIERAAILSDGKVIHERDLPSLGRAEDVAGAGAETLPAPGLEQPLKEQLLEIGRRVERRAIVAALRAEAGSPTRAARRLGISRASFYNKLKELEINV
jgi:DNA-binding NtrC family response regulator